MLFSVFLVTFPNRLLYFVYLVFGGLTMAAPMVHLTIKFNSIKFNSLGLLFIKHVNEWIEANNQNTKKENEGKQSKNKHTSKTKM